MWYKRHLILYKDTSLRIQAFKFKNDQDQDHRIQEQARSPWIQIKVEIKIKFKFKFIIDSRTSFKAFEFIFEKANLEEL